MLTFPYDLHTLSHLQRPPPSVRKPFELRLVDVKDQLNPFDISMVMWSFGVSVVSARVRVGVSGCGCMGVVLGTVSRLLVLLYGCGRVGGCGVGVLSARLKV